MANLASSIENIRKTKRRTKINQAWKSQIDRLSKQVRGLARGKKLGEDPQEFLKKAQKVVDKAAQKGVIHRNRAARLKSRWSRHLLPG